MLFFCNKYAIIWLSPCHSGLGYAVSALSGLSGFPRRLAVALPAIGFFLDWAKVASCWAKSHCGVLATSVFLIVVAVAAPTNRIRIVLTSDVSDVVK